MHHEYEALVNDTGRGKPKYSEKNLSKCHLVHPNPHIDCLELNPGPAVRVSVAVYGSNFVINCFHLIPKALFSV
jgi:hypothetical protein